MNGISGSELYMLQILPELKRRGYEVEMLIIYPVPGLNNKVYIQHLAENGIITHEIYNHGALSPILFYKMLRILKTGKYDIVQSNLVHADFWMATIKMFLKPQIKLLSVKHGFDSTYQAKYGFDLTHLKRFPYYWIEKYACRFIDLNVTISKGLYNVYVKGGIVKQSKIRNIYYGLTVKQPVDQSQIIAIPEGPYLLMVARLLPVKGHTYVIKAWEKVHAKHPELKLYLAGDGSHRPELEKSIKDAGLTDSIIFLGQVKNPHPLIEKCLFTVLTSAWEGFGLVLLESWLHKKPIIAFNGPAMNEVIDHEQNGLLSNLWDTDDLAQKINFLYEHPELIPKYGEDGFKKLNTYYTLKRMTDETEEVYKYLINGKRLLNQEIEN
jgi:glycosyltransferase involved in cell wall biosynthesis